MKFDRIVEPRFDIHQAITVHQFVYHIDSLLEVVAASGNEQTAAHEVYHYRDQGCRENDTTVCLNQPFREKSNDCTPIHQRNDHFEWQKICGRIPIAHEHIVECIQGTHAEQNAHIDVNDEDFG